MHKATAFAVALLATPATAAQPSGLTPTGLADGFFRTIQAGDVARAYKEGLSGDLMSKRQAEIENVVNQNNAMLNLYGKVTGWELVEESQISPSYAKRIYILRTENAPIFYRLYFYKPSSSWTLNSVFFADNYEKLGK